MNQEFRMSTAIDWTPLHMDFAQRIVMTPYAWQWIESPAKTVSRVPLARAAAEHGHATSIVRYAPNASFPEHSHPGGEEILVLEGVFQDEHGDYPAGTYLRNPIGTRHCPRSESGCLLFVKLCQFAPDDRQQIAIQTRETPFVQGHGGLRVLPLHAHRTESTALVFWPKGERFLPHTHVGGEEIFVISGEFIDEHGRYPQGSWLRSPHMSVHHPWVEEDTLIYVKTGHLG
jgi:anti-sigma factor ChrR (cupin superfamily)